MPIKLYKPDVFRFVSCRKNHETRQGDAAKPLANHKNWRIQPQNQQQEALNGMLRQPGWVRSQTQSYR
jgi:hypothetical protein